MKLDRCPTCRRRMTRSSNANRRYWALLHVISDKIKPEGQMYSTDTWHLHFKKSVLGCDDTRLPSGIVISIPRSTADLDVSEFSEYMTQVEAWANQNGAWLEDAAFAA